MLDPDDIYSLLPGDGEHLGFEAVRAAISERSGRDISEEELAQCIFALGHQKRVDWMPEERQLRRVLPGQDIDLPGDIRQEKDLESWLERYLWLNNRSFYDPPPRSLAVIVENTARRHTGAGRWTRPDLSMACVSRSQFRTSISSRLS